MIDAMELRRIESGPGSEERPVGVGYQELHAVGPGRAVEILQRVQEVLRIVLAQSEPWPDLKSWRTLLPPWFAEQFRPEETKEEADEWLRWWRTLPRDQRARVAVERKWSLENWLYWLEPERRNWRWWDARVLGPDELLVRVTVFEHPAPVGALIWLLRAAGASSVPEADK